MRRAHDERNRAKINESDRIAGRITVAKIVLNENTKQKRGSMYKRGDAMFEAVFYALLGFGLAALGIGLLMAGVSSLQIPFAVAGAASLLASVTSFGRMLEVNRSMKGE